MSSSLGTDIDDGPGEPHGYISRGVVLPGHVYYYDSEYRSENLYLEIVDGHRVLNGRTLCGDDALDLDLVFQVARLGKVKSQLHAKPCFGRRAECL